MSRRRKVEIPAAESVLDELYAYRPDEPEPEPELAGGQDQQPEPAPAPSPAGEGQRSRPAPAGMVRATWYVPASAARELSAAADQIVRQLGGLVPRHRVLAALMEAAVGQAPAVAGRLRRELLAELDQGANE